MSHALTEVDTFTATVVVPDGTDPGSGRTNDVETLAQALANRTKNLNDHAARRDVTNTFTVDQTINADLAVTGEVSTVDLDVSGTAAIPNVSGNVNVAGSIDSGSDIFASDDVIAGNEFQYGAPLPTREVILFPEGGPLTSLSHVGLAAGEGIAYHVRVPQGASLGVAKFKIQDAVNAIYDVYAFRTHSINFGSVALPTTATVDTVHVNPGLGAVINGQVDFAALGALSADNDSELYWVYIQCDALSPASINVWAASITFTDPGPRNH